jgi:hypothetical protein
MTKTVKCVKCGATDRAFKRVNPKGEAPAVWECVDCTELPKGDTNLFRGMDAESSRDFQLQEWLKGNPLHNPITNECCVDFSCCEKSLLMVLSERVRFVKSYNDGSIILYGPQGCGKTKNAEAIAKKLGLQGIIDNWIPGKAMGVNTLHLTNVPGVPGALSYRAVASYILSS